MRKATTNTTIQNLTKQVKLTKEHVFPKHIVSHPSTTLFLSSLLKLTQPKEEIVYNLGKHLLAGNPNPIVQDFLAEHNYPQISFSEVPDEFDLLGAAYQYLNTKYENLTMGSFYTSRELAYDMTKNMSFDDRETLCDPSCGSGVFLLAGDIPADRLYGVDFDPIAVMIAKFNFFFKFPDTTIYPQIYQADFLEWYVANSDKRFTYMVGNPPYGANLDLTTIHSEYITTGESFSYFIEYGFYLLEDRGQLSFLVPEALLNVKRHIDIRNFILDKTNLTKIKSYNTKFSGVMSDIYQLELDKKDDETLQFIDNGVTNVILKSSFKELKNNIFAHLAEDASSIIKKVTDKSSTTLKGSTFALGVVTGDNVKKLLDEASEKTEVIFTGKEIEKYRFLPSKKHIVFDRKNLQQVAPDAVYRADAKLVYKVISTRLKVALDLGKSLTTASANIIIPKVQNNNVYSVILLLNSDLYSFLNQKLHGSTNKISRENLEALPLPRFNQAELTAIEASVKNYLAGKVSESELQKFVYSYFGITTVEQEYIEENLA